MNKSVVLSLFGALVLLAGCGSTASTALQHSTSQTASAAPVAPSSRLTSITMVQAVASPAFAPVYLAQKLGYFKRHGLSVKVVPMQGGRSAATALIGGNAHFDAGVASDVLLADAKGNDLESVAAINNSIFLVLDMSAKYAKAHRITAQSTLSEKLKALQGAKIGITSPGSLTDLSVRFMLGTVGLKPNVDYHEIALGSPASNLAALDAGTTQAAIFDPSFGDTAQRKGTAIRVAAGGDFPTLKNAAFGCIIAKKSYVDQHPHITQAVAQSIAEADNLLLDHPNQALKLLYGRFKLPPAVLNYAVPRYDFARDGRTTANAWTHVAGLFIQNHLLTPAMGKRVAKNFTNQYVSNG